MTFFPVRLLSSLVAVLLCSACIGGTSDEARFYLLSSEQLAGGGATTSAAITQQVELGPIHLAQYLDRPQIVTGTGDNRIALAEFDRWAGRLSDEISRLLVQQLSRHQPGLLVRPAPWRLAAAPDVQLELWINQFEGVPGGAARLQARYLLRRPRRTAQQGQLHYQRQTTGPDYPQLVAAQAELIADLAADLARLLGKEP